MNIFLRSSEFERWLTALKDIKGRARIIARLDSAAPALGNVARAKGIAEVAKGAGLGRESLYKALSAGAHPRYGTVSAVLRALGVRLAMVIEQPRPARRKSPRARAVVRPPKERLTGARV